ncbi:alpha-galactosidase [Terricaulis silvestris]|uniref:Alpha-galactosidase n=1 Tax=Terricaulis silvestris TaxID=2686094 RepID=A0A6I6MQA6_9CAUL|nr:alpha-galactosidase [Terricaulis silvestris]QGZ94944.1 Alpha-galactosidase [Terricaulis silvestris]
MNSIRARETIDRANLGPAWAKSETRFSRLLSPGVGFSFFYQGKAHGPELDAAWSAGEHQATGDGDAYVFDHVSGLRVTRTVRAVGPRAIEYQLTLQNLSEQLLDPISSFQPLNIVFVEAERTSTTVHSFGGGASDGCLPPRAFALRKQVLTPSMVEHGMVELGAEGGRSSGKDMPFFFVHKDDLHEGLFAALGWSGQWGAVVRANPMQQTLNIRGKIADLNLSLEAGEEIVGPTILLGFYQGELSEGSNQLRRLIREHYAPRLSDAEYTPIATYDTFFGLGGSFDEELLTRVADEAAALGQECFLLDAGWYKGDDWFVSLGNWDVNEKRFPSGLRAFADHVRNKGMKFGLWFEPERVAEGSALASVHPEWVLWDYGRGNGEDGRPPWFGHVPWTEDFRTSLPESWFSTRFGLLNFARSDVQDYVVELISRYIRDFGVGYIRYDCNLDPLPYWNATDEPGRRGITQLKYIQGFYAAFDLLRTLHPDVILEGCSSGGRRIDLETVRRFHTMWISDCTVDSAIVRFHLFGLSHLLPGSYNYVAYAPPVQHPVETDRISTQHMFAGAIGTGGRLDLWPPAMRANAMRDFDVWKRLRLYLMEDYYALTDQPGDLNSWSAWQFHDPDDQSGFVQTFRGVDAKENRHFNLRGLDAHARYRFVDAFSGDTFETTGADALEAGIETRQAQNASRVFQYSRTAGPASP